MTEDQVIERLRKRCAGHGGQRQFARQAGVSEALVSMILSGDTPIGPKVLPALGLRRVVSYVPENSACVKPETGA